VIFRRVLLALMAAATFAAAAAVVVVALAFALYAFVEPYLGRAGAAATVALVVAVLIGLAGMIMALAGRARRSRAASALSGGFLERAIAFVRQKPILAASAAIGAGLMASRNPKYLGEAIRAFLDGGSSPK
jgi:uncharacterized membrane protein YdfJ with MMPL/SSD domain